MEMLERVFGDRMSFLTSTSSDYGRDAGIIIIIIIIIIQIFFAY